DQGHGEERVAVDDLEVVDRKDVGMVELGERLGLGLEALDEAVVLEQLRGERLERDLASQWLLHGAVDDRHAAAAEALDDLVLAEARPGQVFHVDAALARFSTIAMRSASRNGLLRTLSAPAARKRSRSLDIECALAITIGIAGISALMRRIASRPSMPGMATSMRIIAGRWWRAMSTACSPSPAIKTGYPAFSSTRLQSRCATSLSSATRTEGGLVVPAPSVSGMPELQCVRAFGRERDREVEGRAVTDGAFHPDLAPVHLHDLLNDREAEASPGNRLRGAAAYPTEAFEDVPDLVLRDADAGVGDADQDVASVGAAGQGDGPALG